MLRPIFATVWLWLAFSGAAAACSCARATVEDQFRNAKHVFIARIDTVKYDSARRFDGSPQIAGYTMLRRLKVSSSGPPSLRSGYGGGDCGVPLVVGLQYLVLVGDNGELNMCSGFFGPLFDWNRAPAKAFAESVADFYRRGTPIGEPPPGVLGIGDSYIPPPPPPSPPPQKPRIR